MTELCKFEDEMSITDNGINCSKHLNLLMYGHQLVKDRHENAF